MVLNDNDDNNDNNNNNNDTNDNDDNNDNDIFLNKSCIEGMSKQTYKTSKFIHV